MSFNDLSPTYTIDTALGLDLNEMMRQISVNFQETYHLVGNELAVSLLAYALLAGRSGGQVLYGGTAAGDDLTLRSTSNATKGHTYVGTQFAFDETNSRLGIGTLTPDADVTVLASGVAPAVHLKTYATGAGFRPGVIFSRANGTEASPTAMQSGDYIGELTGRGHDGTSMITSIRAGIRMRAAGNWSNTSHPTKFDFVTTPSGSTTAVVRMEIDAEGNVVTGDAAIATNATDGFLHIAGCPGAPSGTPTAYTGMIPLVVNSATDELMLYSNGAWVMRHRSHLDGWYYDNVGAGTAATQMVRFANGADVDEVYFPRAGSITGVWVHTNDPRTAGTLTVEVYKNGVATGLTAVLDGTNTTFKATTQAAALDTFVAGDQLDIRFSTDAGWTPIAADIRAGLEVLT